MTTSAITSSVSSSDVASLSVDVDTLSALSAALESSSESACAVVYGCDDSDPA